MTAVALPTPEIKEGTAIISGRIWIISLHSG